MSPLFPKRQKNPNQLKNTDNRFILQNERVSVVLIQKAMSRTLEITVLSAEHLFDNRKPAAKNIYVVVRTESLNSFTTSIAKKDGSVSSWNEKFFLEMPMHAKSITFEVFCKSSMAVKSVGVARIAVSEFLTGSLLESYLQFLSYRLRDREGRRNGIINFSVRVKTPEYFTKSPAVEMPVNEKSSCGYQMRVAMGVKNSNIGVATRIPISWNYPSN